MVPVARLYRCCVTWSRITHVEYPWRLCDGYVGVGIAAQALGFVQPQAAGSALKYIAVMIMLIHLSQIVTASDSGV